MKVTLKQAFSILDGRLSTKIEDVYEMLNYIYSDSLMTHQLSSAMRRLKEINPEWFSEAVSVLDIIKEVENTNDFEQLIKAIDRDYSRYEIELGKIDETIHFLQPNPTKTP